MVRKLTKRAAALAVPMALLAGPVLAVSAGSSEYDIKTDSIREVLEFDRGRFEPPGDADFLTKDEESLGVPMFDILGPGTYLLDAQVHRAHPDPELVEYGQLLAMKVHRDRGRPGFVGLPELELDVEVEGEFRLKSD
jgi:hypothetical protein